MVARPPQSSVQTYNKDWAQIKGWAAAQKIPVAAVNNVQALDASRLAPGSGYYPMGQAERTRAILAAAGMNYNTALPTDKPGVGGSNIIGNTISNIRGIATGLMPTRLVSNIWDTLKTTVHGIEDPASLEGKTFGDTLDNLLTKTALSWVPGAYDVGVVAGAGSLGAGLSDLARQPVTSVLDVMPALKALDTGVGMAAAKTSVGSSLADRIGVAPKALGQKGMVRIAGGALGSVKIGHVKGFVKDSSGTTILGVKTLAKRHEDAVTKMQMGKPLSGAAHELMQLGNTKTDLKQQLMTPVWNAVAKLTPDKTLPDGTIERGSFSVFNAAAHSGKPVNDLLNDDSLPLDVHQALLEYRTVVQEHEQVALQAGDIIQARLSDGSVGMWERTAPVHNMIKKADDAHALADAASAVTDRMADDATHLDWAMHPVIQKITETKDAIAGTITHGPGIHSTYVKLFGELTGHDGLLEQMQRAIDTQDWKLLEDASKKADTKMKSPFVKGRAGKEGTEGASHRLARDPAYLAGRDLARQGKELTSEGVDSKKWQGWRDERQGVPVSKRAVEPIEGWSKVPQLAELQANIEKMNQYAKLRLKMDREYKKRYTGEGLKNKKKSAAELNKAAAKADDAALKWARENFAANYRDVFLNRFYDNWRKSITHEANLDAAAADLKGRGYDEEIVNRLRRDPRKLYELIVAVADPTFRDPFIGDMTPADHALFRQDALNYVEKLRAQAGDDPEKQPMWVPTTGVGVAGEEINPRVYLAVDKRPTVDSAHARAYDMSSTVNDAMIGLDHAVSQQLSRDGTIEFAHSQIKPMLHARKDLRDLVAQEHIGAVTDQEMAGAAADLDTRIQSDYGMSIFDIPRKLGVKNSDMGLIDGETYYIPTAMHKGITQLVEKDQFPLKGAWDKTTQVFKFSILGLSPRYTAHILLGGTMLMALRIDPRSFAYIGRAVKAVNAYHRGEPGELDARVMQGAAQRGNDIPSINWRGGKSMGNLKIQEKLASWGIDHRVATAAQWTKAAANINFRFTNYISDIQRSISYFDGVKKAERHGYVNDPLTGERITMTSDKAHAEGMLAAERVMGNLQAMTPLERSVARKIMPFYGWTKHILKYVLSYPVDHPWRTSFLSVLATQNTDNFSSGLDTRMQLLFFLGQPDQNGNVSAVDARALDPFRDVANYATLGGWLSAMNPVLTAPLAYIDPEIIYGGNVLHPSITYDSVYGTNVAGAGGSQMGAAEQEIPELSVIDQALGLTAQARSVAKSGGEGKAIFQALNIPFAQVQHLNLQQIAAKHELDRYNQAANDALNAWDSGDFSLLLKYPGTVPDPLQKDYNIAPKDLYALYHRALKANPTVAPSETVPSLPAPSI